MLAFRTHFNELFAPIESELEGALENQANGWTWNRFFPAADVRSVAEGYQIDLDVPGMTEKEISVTLESALLTLEGERKAPEADGQSRMERPFGKFSRTFRLPQDADIGRIEAVCKNGVLTVKIPKAEAAKAKTIEVHAA